MVRGAIRCLIPGPSVSHKKICQSEGALRLSEGALCRREVAVSLSEGPLLVSLALRQSKNIFLVRRALCRLTLEGPPSVKNHLSVRGPSVYQRGPSVGQKMFSWSEGPPSFNTRRPSVGHRTICRSEVVLRLSEGALCRSEGTLRPSEGSSVGQISPPSVKKTWSQGPSVV